MIQFDSSFSDGLNQLAVSENRGTPKSSISIGFSIINHPFWGIPNFWKHPDGLNQLEKKTLDLGIGRGQQPHAQGPPSVATAWDACFTVHRTSGFPSPAGDITEPTEVHGANRVNGCLGYTTEKITWNPKMKLIPFHKHLL